MNMLASLTTSADITGEKDSVGGSSFGPVDSGLYAAKVEHAFVKVADSGALGLECAFKTSDNKIIRETFWMTSGKAKGGKNTYTDKNGKEQYLPGFTMANSLAQLTTGFEINQLETEQKVIKQYSREAGAEVPATVAMVMDVVGKEILLGVVKEIQDKTAKGDDGKYHPTGETREVNVIDKLFHAETRKTVSELKAKVEEAAFVGNWAEKHTGKVYDKTTKDAGGTAGAPKRAAGAATAASGAAKKPTSSLFA